MTRDELRQALTEVNVQAFLRVIRYGEGTSDEDGYRRHFGGELFSDFSDHPRKVITKSGYTSTAAGAYQFLSKTWDGLVRQYGFTDFSPASQDEGAVALIVGRKALPAIRAGRIEEAIKLCNREWASLPGSPYGQPTKTLAQALKIYTDAGGVINQSGGTMPIPAIVGALLPVLTSAVPELVKLINPDSSAAKKNAEVAGKVFDIAQEAIGAVNAQEVAERIQNDPKAAQTVRQAVQDHWYELAEVSGGIVEARKADLAFVRSGEPVWKSPSFVVAIGLMPLVYMVVGAVVGLFGQPFSEDVRAAIANGIVGLILGGLIGYYYGQTTSRNRTPVNESA